MIKPVAFDFNAETAVNNAFQQQGSNENAQQKAEEEFDGFVQKLSDAGVDVTVVKDTPVPHTPDSIFPNNWISFHQDGSIVLYPMYATNRRAERKQHVLDTIAAKFDVKQQIDFTSKENEDLFLEGTGSMVLDREKKIAYACLSPRTDKAVFEEISGVSLPVTAEANDVVFPEDMLFTHRGLSGPAILQISSYWQPGDELIINLSPQQDLNAFLLEQQQKHPEQELKTILSRLLPKRLVEKLLELNVFQNQAIKALHAKSIQRLADSLTHYVFKPNGTEGYRTAEVTLGGIDSNELSSKTMEASKVAGLYFIGEVMDVSGWLGGFNFQWAWASGVAAGQVV